MRAIRLAFLPLLVAASLSAQAPATSNAPVTPAAVASPQRTAFFDVAALVDSRQRFGLEPLVLGRWSVGLIGTHSRSSAPAQLIAYPNPIAAGPTVPTTLCPVPGCPWPYPGSASGYNAWSLDFAVRYYPAVLSFNDARRRFMVYLGEFVGYHRRTIEETVYPPVPLAGSSTSIPCPVLQDSVAPRPIGCYPLPGPYTSTRRLTGWEPGAEIGVRLKPLDPVFIDVGGWFKLVTIDDPMQRIKPGQLDSRLVVAVGIGW